MNNASVPADSPAVPKTAANTTTNSPARRRGRGTATGLVALLDVEVRAMWRTWHRYLLPIVLTFLALLSVMLSRFAPELMRALVGSDFQIKVPAPSPDQSYAQWAKNLSQTGLFAVIVTGAGATSSLISSGRAQLLAVRPVSRAAQPVAAFFARAAVLGISTLLGTAVVWAATLASYSSAPPARLLAASGAWIACALVFLALTVGLSALTGSTLAAVGASIAAYVVCTLLAMADPIARHWPVGLVNLPTLIASDGSAPIAVPLTTGALAATLCLAVGASSFARREL